jgi:hypothetical protein
MYQSAPPVFSPTLYDRTLAETVAVGSSVLSLHALVLNQTIPLVYSLSGEMLK